MSVWLPVSLVICLLIALPVATSCRLSPYDSNGRRTYNNAKPSINSVYMGRVYMDPKLENYCYVTVVATCMQRFHVCIRRMYERMMKRTNERIQRKKAKAFPLLGTSMSIRTNPETKRRITDTDFAADSKELDLEVK